MTAKDYLTALKVIREIQRKQAAINPSAYSATLMIIFTISLFMMQRQKKVSGTTKFININQEYSY